MKRWLNSGWTPILGLFLLLLVLCATRVLTEPDEGRYGEIGRWMLVSGDWLAPRVDGVPFMHKPPYVYWLEGAFVALFGAHAWSVRLVPALHALLMLAALYLGAREAVGEVTARRASLMLGTSLAFLMGGQYVNHDMAVAAWINVAIWCFALHFVFDRPRLALLGFAACALGVLSKGLIGIVLPGLVLLPWLVWTGRWRRIAGLPWLAGLAIFLAIAAPWFVIGEMRYPGLAAYIFGVQHFGRYTGTTFNNPQPWWFYLAGMAVLLFPWFLLAPAALRRGSEEDARETWRRLGWVWLVAIVVFFSFPRSKLIGYVLPAVAPLALLAALGLERLGARRKLLLGGGLALALAAAALTQAVAMRESSRRSSAAAASWLACAARPSDTIYALGGYPYALPFYLGTDRPLVVLTDWEQARKATIDDWRSELLEGVPFDPPSGWVLQDPAVLREAALRPRQWVVSRGMQAPAGFTRVHQTERWSVYLSDASAPERPEAAQHEGLPGCRDQRQKQ